MAFSIKNRQSKIGNLMEDLVSVGLKHPGTGTLGSSQAVLWDYQILRPPDDKPA
jgi:hypothetical protein